MLRVINNVSYIVILLLIVCDHDDVYMCVCACCVTKKNGVLSAAVSFCAVFNALPIFVFNLVLFF